METRELLYLAQAAGFDLSQAETALLQALDSTGHFDGVEFQQTTEGMVISDELSYRLPSIWREGELESEPVASSIFVIRDEPGSTEDAKATPQSVTDSGAEPSDTHYMTRHKQLFTEAPFPTISAALFAWLLSPEAAERLPSLHIAHIKVASSVAATDCDINCEIELYECIFEHGLQLTGKFGQRLYLSTVLADSLLITGECPAGIGFNNVQVRSFVGPVLGGHTGLTVSANSSELDVYGLYTPAGLRISDCTIAHIHFRPRTIAKSLDFSNCNCNRLHIDGGGPTNGARVSVSAQHLIAGSCRFENVRAVSMSNTVIKGDCRVDDLRSLHQDGLYLMPGIDMDNVEIKGTLSVSIAKDAGGISLTYDHVSVHRYEDRYEDLSKIERLQVDGLAYDELADWPDDEAIRQKYGQAARRMRWLDLQSQEPFPLTSWRRLVAQQRHAGRYHEARHLLIQGERRRRAALHHGFGARFWSWFLRATIGYGWELWRVAWFAVVLLFLGAAVAFVGETRGLFTQTSSHSGNIAFNALIYSLDTALPIVDLGHASLWIPSGQGVGGKAVQLYFWIHILLGWMVATLLVIGFTGIARKIEAD